MREDAMLTAHVQASTTAGVVHVPHEHPQFAADIQFPPTPPASVPREHEVHEGQHTFVHL